MTEEDYWNSMTENDKIYEFVLKPTVVFLHIENLPIVVGWPAIIYTLNHPVYGVGKVRAGWVLNVWQDDNHNVVRFETKDAYYVDKDGDDNFFRTEKMNSLANFKIKNPNGIKIRDFDFLSMEIMDGGTGSVECVA